MRQLSGLDASFLSIETPSQTGHVSSLTVYDLEAWAGEGSFFEGVLRVIAGRVHLLPVLRRRLVEVPFGLDHPYWIDDPDFDLEFHVRNLALPLPGNGGQLADQVARLVARPLDRARPLWEIYVIDGLEGNRAAMLTKVHHTTIDGVQGVEMLATILDEQPEGRDVEPPATPWKGEQPPSTAELLSRTAVTLARNPARAVRLQYKAVRSGLGLARSARSGTFRPPPVAADVADRLALAAGGARRTSGESFPLLPNRPAPRTPFNKSITPHRRYAFGSVPLADAKLVKTAFGTTINDVVMAMSASALRRYLLDLDALPVAPLIAMVPISVRSGNENDAYSNQVSSILASLHTNLSDPVARLAAIHETTAAAKGMSQAIPADLLTDLAHFAPPALLARASRLMTRTSVMNRINPPFNLVVSNVPGPRVPLFTSGARLLHFYPVSTIVEGQGINITVQSYLGTLDFGVITCRELVPDAWKIIEYLGDAIEELVRAARAASDAVPDQAAGAGGPAVTTRRAAKAPPRRRAAPTT